MKIPTLQAFTAICGSLAVAAHDWATRVRTPRQVGRSALSHVKQRRGRDSAAPRRVLPHDVAAAMTLVRIALIEFAWRDESAAAIAHVPRHTSTGRTVDRTPAMRPHVQRRPRQKHCGAVVALVLSVWLVLLLMPATVSAQQMTAQPTSAAWSGASVIHRADHPRVVSTDRDRMVLLVAPFLRGVQDGTSGLLSLHLAMPAIAPEILFRSTTDLLPNHLAPVLDDGTHVYWLSGLRIMQTSKTTRQSRQLSDKGALAMAVHGNAIYTFNHNNERKLLRIDSKTGEVRDVATLPFVASSLHVDASGAWLLTTPSPLRQVTAIVRFDFGNRRWSDVYASADAQTQIRALVPVGEANTIKSDATFYGLYFVERNLRKNRAVVRHINLLTGSITALNIDAIDELSPIRADESALYYFAPESRQFNSPMALYQYTNGGGKQMLSRGTTGPTSMTIQRFDGKSRALVWTDINRVYSLGW